MTTPVTVLAAVPPSKWGSRLASLKSRYLPDDDARVAECRAALSYWRCRKVIEAERDTLAPDVRDALAKVLRGEVTQ